MIIISDSLPVTLFYLFVKYFFTNKAEKKLAKQKKYVKYNPRIGNGAGL